MRRSVCRYMFDHAVPMDEVFDTLRLAVLATESIFGRRRTLLETNFDLHERDRTCWIDTSTVISQHLNQVFRGFIVREFGAQSFLLTGTAHAPRPEDNPANA